MVRDFWATEGCDWKFVPSHGTRLGELREAAVKAMKYHLRRTVGSQFDT